MVTLRRATQQPSTPQQRAILVLVVLATALSNLEVGLVNVALPTLAATFGVGRATIQWVAIAYQLAIVGTLVLFGRLVDLVGARRLYVAGMTTFAAASLLAALSRTVLLLIVARGLLGVGAAMLLATGQALVVLAHPVQRQGRALGVMHMAVAGGLMVGPSLGGLLMATVGWRAIFLAPLPPAMFALLLAAKSLPVWAAPARERLDIAGAALICTWASLIVIGLTRLSRGGWGMGTWLLLALALGAGVLFVLVEFRHVAPLVDLRLVMRWDLATGLLTTWLTFVALAANMFLVPFALQTLMGHSAAVAGLVMMTVPIAILPVAPVAGALADRFGSSPPTTAGLAAIVVAILGMAQFRATSPLWFAIAVLALYGVGAGLFQAPNNRAVLGAAPRGRVGMVSGMLALSRNLGQVIGVLLASTVWTWRQAYYERAVATIERAVAAGLHDAFLVLAGCGMLALLVSAGCGSDKAVIESD
ncbi:MAG: MFS transporter [Thermomicrobiales bacterium]